MNQQVKALFTAVWMVWSLNAMQTRECLRISVLFMEADASFNEEDYFMNFFDAMEYRGELLQFSPSFRVGTAAAKTEYAGSQQGLSFSEYMELADTMPSGMSLFGDQMSRSSLLGKAAPLGNLGEFVDAVQAECRFDTPELVDILECCSTIPAKSEISLEENPLAFSENKAMIKFETLITPYSYHDLTEGVFGGADVTLIGLPVADDSNGGVFCPQVCLAMSSQSEYKEEIWEFFRFLLSESYQNTLSNDMPVNRNSFRYQAEKAMQPTVPEGEFDYLHSMLVGETDVPLGEATQEEMDTLYDYVGNITRSSYMDNNIWKIINEESEMYFAGDQTAEKAAEAIQNRTLHYLAEQFG